jgi:hypothetical protein
LVDEKVHDHDRVNCTPSAIALTHGQVELERRIEDMVESGEIYVFVHRKRKFRDRYGTAFLIINMLRI